MVRKSSSLKKNLLEVVLKIKLNKKQLANDWKLQIIRKYKKRKVYSSFKYNIWGVDSADMQLISKCNN